MTVGKILTLVASATVMLPLLSVADTVADPPCVGLCAGGLPNAVTQLGLIPAPVGFPPNGITFNGDGGAQAIVKILDQAGDVVGSASAAGQSTGASRTTTVAGGQLNNFGSASATAGVTIDPDFSATASAHTKFDFWLRPVSSIVIGGMVPLIVTDRFDIRFTPGGGNAVAQVKVSGDFGPSQPLLFADEFFDPISTSVSHRIQIPAGGIIQVEMEAKANEFGAGGGMAEADADPSFQIDPNFPGASSFGFEVSPDLAPTPVPELATIRLVACCLGIAGLRCWLKAPGWRVGRSLHFSSRGIVGHSEIP